MKKKKVLASVATVTIFGVITRVISFVFKIYLSRKLGAEAIGLYQMAVSVFFLFAAFACGGIPVVLSRKTAENSALGKSDDHNLLSSALLVGCGISIVLCALIGILNDKLSFLFSDKGAVHVFLIMSPALLSTTVYSVLRAYLWGKKEFSAFSATETAEEILRIAFCILFLSGMIGSISGANGVALAFTVSDVTVAMILLAIFFIKGGRLKKPTMVKGIIVPSLPVTGMRIFGSLMATLIAFILPFRLMAYGMSSAEATASYGRIAGMATPLLFAPNAIIGSIAIVLVPEMSANGAKKAYADLNRHLNNGINFALLISGAFLVIYLALGKDITCILYKDEISGEYLRFASFLVLPMGIAQLTQSALNSIGKEYRAFANYLISNAFLIVAIIILPKYIGIYSVAVASMLSTLITCALNVYALNKYTGFGYSFLKYFVYVLLFALPCAFGASSLNNVLDDNVFTVALSALFGVVAYAGLCFAAELVDIKGFLKLRKKRT